jgi:hypothetical protein
MLVVNGAYNEAPLCTSITLPASLAENAQSEQVSVVEALAIVALIEYFALAFAPQAFMSYQGCPFFT